MHSNLDSDFQEPPEHPDTSLEDTFFGGSAAKTHGNFTPSCESGSSKCGGAGASGDVCAARDLAWSAGAARSKVAALGAEVVAEAN